MIGSNASFTRRLLRWYEGSRRELPWRVPRGSKDFPDAYHVLLSETMLQQTQVATVIPYFHRFLERFPTLADLAAAQEQDVLRMWQGLGYYSRARNLSKAAQQIVAEHGGKVPSSLEALKGLPGIGRYTAGAIASLAFDQRAPILDGNVQRVLCRIDKIEADPRDRRTQELLWDRAEQIVPRSQPGEFNSAMMELGAVVCTPRSPQCLICPVNACCEAFAAGLQDQIPIPKKAAPTPILRRHTYCISHDEHWLIEQRPATGRWASMWQFITIDPQAEAAPCISSLIKNPKPLGKVRHALTHRRYEFHVFRCAIERRSKAAENRAWVTLEGLNQFPLPRPHVLIAKMLQTSLPPESASRTRRQRRR